MVILGANNIALHILFVLSSLLILLCSCAYMLTYTCVCSFCVSTGTCLCALKMWQFLYQA